MTQRIVSDSVVRVQASLTRFCVETTLLVIFTEYCTNMRGREYVDGLASRGRHHLSAAEAIATLRGGASAVRAQLRRLKAQGLLAEPVRGFLVIVPSEYRHLGCLPAEQFVPQLLDLAAEPYYIALLSAAHRHGAAHQRPQAVQVMVRKNRAPIECGKVRVEFIARGDLEKLPVTLANTPRGVARYSTPEVTALELVGYPDHAGGLSNVATVVAELAEEMDGEKLAAAAQLSPVSWAQRLGYILELVGQEGLANSLKPFVQEHARSYTPLRRAAGTAGAKRDPTWKLIVNVELEPDL
ncbi:MAG: type IV toxin-antitoxin system AbiEi family antitoxin [Planctomycetes bacterium]|nr:type IV toxin-antitoxin system AbiEi family antitoxin [Planctomycetota bacterium]